MRALFHGPQPELPTGYASQLALIVPRVQTYGHDVAISVTAGQDSHPGWWKGIPVFPCTPYADVGEDTVAGHYHAWKADIVFTMLDTWLLKYPQVWRGLRTVHLTPVDCDPMGRGDWEVLNNTHGTPAAISEFGLAQLRKGRDGQGFEDALFLPHGIDTKLYCPAADRDQLRDDMHWAGKFVVGMNFMNNDRARKNVNEAMRGFALFHGEHPDTVLALHAIQALPEGLHLPKLAAHLGIGDVVAWSPQYELVCGLITPKMLADWYGSLDVLMDIGNEGFGLTGVEAQACGTPVIRGAWSTGPELVGPGWLVTGQGYWNNKHEADWQVANVTSVHEALEKAYLEAGSRRAEAREFALGWEIGRQVRDHWEPVLAELG